MSRLPNWRHRLASYVSDKARAEFDPGQTDCALFAAGAVEAVTGHDPAQGHRGRYNTIQGGLRRLRKSGTTDHVAMAARLFAEIPVNLTTLEPMLEDLHSRLAGVVIECLDFGAFLQRYDSPETLFYLDPPYWGSEGDYGKHLFSRQDFQRLSGILTGLRRDDHAVLADRVLRLKASWLMTYDNAPEIEALYETRRRYRFSINYSAQEKRVGTELMVLSDDIELPLSQITRVRSA